MFVPICLHIDIFRMLLSRNRVQWMLMRISEIMKEAELVANVHCHIDKGLMEMTTAFSTCDRIFTTPIPLMYTRHTARFLLIWLLTVPMSLYHEFRKTQTIYVPLIIPLISFFNAIFLFGIEELGVQIEEPFSILPLANICNDIQYAGEDMLAEKGVSWFDSVEKSLEKDKEKVKERERNNIEKDVRFDVDRDILKLNKPSAKDVFVYSKTGESSNNDKTTASSLINSRNNIKNSNRNNNNNNNNNMKNSVIGVEPPNENDVELSKARKDLEDAVNRNISSSSKRDLFNESRNKEARKIEKNKNDLENSNRAINTEKIEKNIPKDTVGVEEEISLMSLEVAPSMN